MTMRMPCLAVVLLALTSPAAAAARPAGKIEITNAWSRPVAAGLPTGVAYATLRNTGRTADRFLGAVTSVAARATLHMSMDRGGMMSMRPATGGLALPPGGGIVLAPGGYHLMLQGLKGGLKAGSVYPMTFRFSHAGDVTVDIPVRATAP